LAQPLLLRHAEAVLLVDDDQTQLAILDVLESRRCVPMTMSTSPAASAAIVAFCSFGVRKRDSTSTRTGKSASRSRT